MEAMYNHKKIGEKKREDHSKLFYYNRVPQKKKTAYYGLLHCQWKRDIQKNEHNKETHFYIVVPILTFGTKKTPPPYKNGPNRS